MADDDGFALLGLLNTKRTVQVAGRTIPIVKLPPFDRGTVAAAVAGSVLAQVARSLAAFPRAIGGAVTRIVGGPIGFAGDLVQAPIETAAATIRVTFDPRIGPLRGQFDQFGLVAVLVTLGVSLVFITSLTVGIREAIERLLGVG